MAVKAFMPHLLNDTKYLVDFAGLEKKLIIEVDGGQHVIDPTEDKIRDEWLRGEER